MNSLLQKTASVWGEAAVGQALLGYGNRLVPVPSRPARQTQRHICTNEDFITKGIQLQ